eukprot:3020110-Pleurochrysis_carterae.AAC.1
MVEDGQTLTDEIEFTEGMEIDRGFVSPYFVKNQARMRMSPRAHACVSMHASARRPHARTKFTYQPFFGVGAGRVCTILRRISNVVCVRRVRLNSSGTLMPLRLRPHSKRFRPGDASHR